MSIRVPGARNEDWVNIDRTTRIYSDLNLDFLPHPVTKDIQKKFDRAAIKQAVKNLVLTNINERPFHPEISSNISAQLFENIDQNTTRITLRKAIEEVIQNFEPRVEVQDVQIRVNKEENGLIVSIIFFPTNSVEPEEFDIFLDKIR